MRFLSLATLRSLFCMAVFITAVMAANRVQAAQVNSIEVESGEAVTYVVVQLSADAEYRYFRLDAPERLVLDISNGVANFVAPPITGLVKSVRSANRSHDNQAELRLVFDLSEAADVSVQKTSFPGGARLNIILEAESTVHAALPIAKPVVPQPSVDNVAKPAPSLANPKPQESLPVLPQVTLKDSKKRRPIRVMIDAGHGGKDTGAIGPNGTREKDVALAISRRLYKLLKDSPDFAPTMSRDGDRYLKLRYRTELARQSKADAFVSIHANSFKDRGVTGSSVYALSLGGASSEHARWLAEAENAADLVGGVSIQDKDDALASVLLDLAQTSTLEDSLELANEVLGGLGAIGRLHKNTVQQAGFLVLKSPDIPSILVEAAYISNPKEERLLRDGRHQQRIAQAVYDGLRRFFTNRPPPGTLFAQAASRYKVRSGDSLSVLADRWGTSTAAIRELNGLSSDQLRIGQSLVVP